MTKEQEAIERMYDLINTCDVGIERHGTYDDLFQKDKEAIETVLSMLKEKDKMIDLMAEQLAGLTIWNNEKEEPLILPDIEDVKQYFERKCEEC